MNNVRQVYEGKPLPDTIDLFFGEMNEKINNDLKSSPLNGFAQVKLAGINDGDSN
jgi:hypothetical protein